MDYSPLQQYVLGWLACDGHFAKNGRSVRVQLQERDLSVLELYRDAFGARIAPAVRVLRGFRYRTANVSSRAFCASMVALFQGRLKRDKQFPEWATTEFVLGCLDADGAFCVAENRRITVHFQHESKAFSSALRAWLEVRGIQGRTRSDRSYFTLEARACRALLRLYKTVPFALARKRSKLEGTLVFTSRWWTAAEVEKLRSLAHLPQGKLAAIFHVSPKAIQLKRWKLAHGYNRRESAPTS